MGQTLNFRNKHLTSLKRPSQMDGKERSNRPNGSLKNNEHFHFSAICLPQLAFLVPDDARGCEYPENVSVNQYRHSDTGMDLS